MKTNDMGNFNLTFAPGQHEKQHGNRKRKKEQNILVPVVGVEPTRCCHHRILSPARLPIPSHRQSSVII